MELHFDPRFYSNLGNENSDTGHIKCSRGPHLARGPRFSTPGLNLRGLQLSAVTVSLHYLPRCLR